MNAKENLAAYVNSLTDEQADRISNHLSIILQLAKMTENEMVFTETFLTGIFGEVSV